MDIDENQSFSSMLNSEYSIYEGFTTPSPNMYVSQDHVGDVRGEVTTISSQMFSSQTSSKDRRSRTKNFTKEEDEMLISAWQNISYDPIIGVDQKNETYWERVHNYFKRYKSFESDRSSGSLMHRWSVIQLAVNKFQGYYEKVGAPSGFSEDDKVDNAKTMYKSIHKTNFPFEHCWKILRFLPKWNDSFATKKPKKSQNKSNATSSPCTPECVVLGESEIQRPIGRKAAKDIEKKRKKLENEHDDGVAILEQMRADQLESKKQRNEHLKEMILLAKERAEREKEKDEREKKREANEQDEADAKIMVMDISSMGPLEFEYFNTRKNEIIERIRNRPTT